MIRITLLGNLSWCIFALTCSIVSVYIFHIRNKRTLLHEAIRVPQCYIAWMSTITTELRRSSVDERSDNNCESEWVENPSWLSFSKDGENPRPYLADQRVLIEHFHFCRHQCCIAIVHPLPLIQKNLIRQKSEAGDFSSEGFPERDLFPRPIRK